jgi:purine-binding chemotaxis protein CheW
MSSKEIKILVFTINNEYYATDIMEVERILGYEIPTKLPDSPTFLEGVINHEGSILPIINLADRFSMHKEKRTDNKIIVVRQKSGKLGIIVDAVSEVIDVNTDTIEMPPEVVSGISKRYIKGLIKTENKIIIFLNLGAILTEEEKQMLL